MKRIKTDEASCKRRHGGIMFLKIQSVTFMLLLIILFSGVVSGGDYNSAAAVLLDRIALGEGTTDAAAQKHGLASAYDITYAYGIYNPKDSKPLTEMTIGEVKQLQQQMLANQAGSSAVGKYQILYKTLFGDARTGAPGLQKTLGLSDNIPFDAATQEKLGLALLEVRNFKDWINGKISDYQFQQNMAKEWASVADPDTGKSRYGTDGMCCGCTPGIKCQSVGTTSEQIREAMTKAKSLFGISQPRITLTLYVHYGSAS